MKYFLALETRPSSLNKGTLSILCNGSRLYSSSLYFIVFEDAVILTAAAAAVAAAAAIF